METNVFGGIDGFLQLCRSLRDYDELKYQYPGSKCDYTQIENDIEMCVSKRKFNTKNRKFNTGVGQEVKRYDS